MQIKKVIVEIFENSMGFWAMIDDPLFYAETKEYKKAEYAIKSIKRIINTQRYEILTKEEFNKQRKGNENE